MKTHFILVLLLLGSTAPAALIYDSGVNTADQADVTALPDQDTTELFPLAESPADEVPARSEMPSFQSEESRRELRAHILDDFANRISPEFHVQNSLRARTEFWFDIYTHYGAAQHIIHHALYPWIVYRVVDTTEILNNGKGPLWLRRQSANRVTSNEVRRIRLALRSLARRRSYANLPPLERALYDKLLPVRGPRHRVFLEAAGNVRSQLGQKDFFARGLVTSSRYLPAMEEEFQRRGLPVELTRMPFVESSFNENARSKVGASGIWQIMPSTGRAYLIVNSQIDERNSPLKATRLAARLLHSYNHALDSWPLTITSYNHGIGNIQKAIRAAHTRDLAEIIRRYHRGDFRFASSNFYTCFLAALYAEKYNELIFKSAPRDPPQDFETLALNGRTRVRYLQKLTGLDRATLVKYNLDLARAARLNAALPRGFELHLPPGYRDRISQRVGLRDRRRRSSG